MAGLIAGIKRGVFQITPAGKRLLQEYRGPLNRKYLETIPAFQDHWTQIKGKKQKQSKEDVSDDIKTPEETIEQNYDEIRQALADDVLSRIKTNTPAFFERLVVELLVKMGYGGSIQDAGKTIGRSGDEGIDGIIKEDKLGLDVIYIQAKRWENIIGRPEIQKFVGALAGQGAKKGIFITTSRFTKEAMEYQPKNETKVVLIDGERLADLMIDHDLGVSAKNTFVIKQIDNDYFDEFQ